MSRTRLAARVALLAVPVVAGLAAFPRYTALALLIAGALALAGSRRGAAAVLCALLLVGAAGRRPDADRRPTTHVHEHPNRSRSHRP